jgi:tripartite-type tricarboxylate transporter receptor subunit TctC
MNNNPCSAHTARVAAFLRKSHFGVLLALCCVVTLTIDKTQAQSYPAKPVRIITGSAPSGGADVTARAIAQKLTESFGTTQFIVDNRSGATGMIANQLVSRAPSDGYTLLLQPSSFVTISAHLNSKEGWDPVKSLTPIVQVSAYGLVLVVHPSVPAKTVKQLIAVAMTRPGVLNFVSSGIGSNFHLAGELFKLRAKIDIVHVPYRGSPAALIDLISGRGDLLFGLVPVLYPYIKEGRLRALAVTTQNRNALLPETPAMVEILPGFEVVSWEGMFGPAGTPPDIVAKLHSATSAILATPEMKESWRSKGVEYVAVTSQQFADRLREDYERTGALIKAIGVTAQ